MEPATNTGPCPGCVVRPGGVAMGRMLLWRMLVVALTLACMSPVRSMADEDPDLPGSPAAPIDKQAYLEARSAQIARQLGLADDPTGERRVNAIRDMKSKIAGWGPSHRVRAGHRSGPRRSRMVRPPRLRRRSAVARRRSPFIRPIPISSTWAPRRGASIAPSTAGPHGSRSSTTRPRSRSGRLRSPPRIRRSSTSAPENRTSRGTPTSASASIVSTARIPRPS
jgi:hypothetical protein